MKTKIKRHSRSVLSVVLTLCMLVSCITVGLITTDAAQAGAAVGASQGYDQWFVKGSFDKNESGTWIEHEIPTNGYEKTLAVGVYNFSFLAKKENSTVKDEFSANETFSATKEYNLQKRNGSLTLNATVPGVYKFEYKGMSSGPSMSIKVTFPQEDESNATWTVAGDNLNLFGVAWADNEAQNDLLQEGNTKIYSKRLVFMFTIRRTTRFLM